MTRNLAPQGWHQRARTRGVQPGCPSSPLFLCPCGTSPEQPPAPGELEAGAVRALSSSLFSDLLSPESFNCIWLFSSKIVILVPY